MTQHTSAMEPGPAPPEAGPEDADAPIEEVSEQALAAAGEFFSALDKAVRARRLYQDNNPVYHGFLASLNKATAGLWDHVSSLSVGVEEHGFRWHSRHFTIGDGRESLPFLFYKDGVRFLTFLPGFEQEIDAFLAVLHRARLLDQRSDDDMVTLLWQAEFVNFQYTYVDALAEGLVVPEATGERLVAPIDLAAAEVAERAAESAPAPYAVESGQGSVVQAITREDFAETLYFLDGSELEQLGVLIREEGERDIRRDVLNALFDRLEDRDPVRQGEVLGILRQLLPTYLASGELTYATHILVELNEVLRKDVLGAREREIVDAVFMELSEPAVLAQLLVAMEDGSIDPRGSELGLFLAHLGPNAMPQLLHAIETSTVPVLQERLRYAMQGLAESNRAQLIGMLSSDTPEVVRGAARLVAQLMLSDAVPALAQLSRHASPDLRRIAAETLSALRTGPALDALRQVLTDGDRDVRVAAARGLTAARYLPARDTLEEIVKGRAIREADLTEKIAFFEAFGSVATPDSVPLLDRLLNGRRLFGRESAELRACAALALGRMGAPAARTALQKALGETEPLVRNAVTKALRREAATS